MAAAKDTAPEMTPERVLREHGRRIYGLVRRLVGNDADAEDVTQEVLLKLFRKGESFRGESAFPTWLHRVAVNGALDHLRRRAAREGHQVRDPLESLLEEGDRIRPLRPWPVAAEQLVIDNEARHVIAEGIDHVPPGYREVLVLADQESLPNAEVAELLGLSVSAVKSRLHRARLMLRNRLAPYFEEQPT